jgi:hypothetical protein
MLFANDFAKGHWARASLASCGRGINFIRKIYLHLAFSLFKDSFFLKAKLDKTDYDPRIQILAVDYQNFTTPYLAIGIAI